ncbi:Tetratricopeptide repeat protein 39B [Halotydeus destructor]|nr:Tetratricopeptide repeat protein 39B [Halotydeus destructor]
MDASLSEVPLEPAEKLSDLESNINEVSRALDLFFDNKLSESLKLLRSQPESLYHTLGLSAATFLYGFLTFEKTDMDEARDCIKNAIDVSAKNRKKSQNITEFFWGYDANDYSDVEIHAELCYAENHIMSGFLTFAQDQSIFALIKAAYRIKTGNDTYRTCQYILNNRKEWSNPQLKKHFESGVCTGVGTANLVLSHLPARVLKILKWAGFSGDKFEALKNLKHAASLRDALRFKIVSLITITYNLYMEQYYGHGKGNLNWSRDLVRDLHEQFPTGVLVLTYVGRIKQLNGDTQSAIDCYQKAINVPIEWKQVHNICYWELCWCYGIHGNWKEAAKYAKLLRSQSNWSKCFVTQIIASFLYMQMIEDNQPELKDEISQEMRSIPKLRKRISGKTIPLEKLAIACSGKYFRQNECLSLPAYEVFYFLNIFAHTGGRHELIKPMLARIEKDLSKFDTVKDTKDAELDNYALLTLLKGVCKKYMKDYQAATDCFNEVIRVQDQVKHDTYIAPHAALELGITYVEWDKIAESKVWLEKAKNDYKGFLVEVLVHLRTHAALLEVADKEAALAGKRMSGDFSAKEDGKATKEKAPGSGVGGWFKNFS